MRRIRAYRFNSKLSLPEIRARFGEVGPWRWIERENDRFGDYISTRALPDPDAATVKIFIDGTHYAVDLKLEAEPLKIEAVYATVFRLLLPAIGATEITELDPIGTEATGGAAMSLGALFSAHLRSPDRASRELEPGLDALGLANEAAAYGAWCGYNHEILGTGAWSGRRMTIGSAPPPAVDGELWFDICELALMVCAGRSWLATRPVAQWQMRGFLEVAHRTPHIVQVAPPYRALDPERLLDADEGTACSQITCGEASLYCWWFGKGLPHLFDWQAAQAVLGTSMRDVWLSSRKEWTSTKLDVDEAARIFVAPSTVDWDPDEIVDSELALTESKRAMLRGEYTREPDIGFRTAVLVDGGLFESVSHWGSLDADVKLVSLLDRHPFE